MTTQSITTLILGTAPENATPATHILAGPWCTAPASAEETGFDMPPEPLADPERLETAARQANRLAALPPEKITKEALMCLTEDDLPPL